MGGGSHSLRQVTKGERDAGRKVAGLVLDMMSLQCQWEVEGIKEVV